MILFNQQYNIYSNVCLIFEVIMTFSLNYLKPISAFIALSFFYHSLALENAYAQPSDTTKKILNEKKVIELFRDQSVALKQEIAASSHEQLGASLTEEQYQARLFTNYNFKKSNEKAMNSFMPILTPYEDWSVGVEKKMPLGLKLGVAAFGTQYSTQNKSLNDATQVGGKVSAELDLWKNIFGRLDRAQLTSTTVQKMRSELQQEVSIKKREVDFRKFFWSYFNLTQSIDLTKELIKSAEKQLADAKSRRAEGIADSGEVARYQSQVETRNSSLLLFEYEKEVTLQFFEKYFKDFRSSDWRIDPDTDRYARAIIGQCLDTIQANININLDYTNYDEMVGLLQKEVESEVRLAKKHADMDLALVGEYQTTGVANSYSDAQDNLEDRKKAGHAIGVRLSIPLGSTKSNSERLLVATKKNSLEAHQVSLMNDLRTTHETMLKSILLLNQGLDRQELNTKSMQVSYREMSKKFRQGRVPVSQLVQEQDALFQSQLRELDLRKQIAYVILDYFSVFNKYPCQWNNL